MKTSGKKGILTAVAMRRLALVLSACLGCACVGKLTTNFVAKGDGTGGSTVAATGAASGTGGSTAPVRATATGGMSGVSLTCGDGKVDPGEDCDQSQLNGSTCTSLGFNGGTLACASNCRFSTSGCSGSLTPVITTSRTTCAAPCEVFFDATKTTSLMGNDYVNASFDWNFEDRKSVV